jgi:hypothetical protein
LIVALALGPVLAALTASPPLPLAVLPAALLTAVARGFRLLAADSQANGSHRRR